MWPPKSLLFFFLSAYLWQIKLKQLAKLRYDLIQLYS